MYQAVSYIWNIANEEEWERTVNEFTNWLNSVFMPIVERCTNDLNNFVKRLLKGVLSSKGLYGRY